MSKNCLSEGVKPKVLILHNRIMHYRVPVLNLLAQECDLTFAYCLGEPAEGCQFKLIHLPTRIILGRLYIQKDNIRKMAKDYDVIITYGTITWVKFSTLPWFNRKKTIIWSLGVSAGYNKPYDQNKRLDFLRKFYFKQADALVFYSEYPIEKYAAMGISRDKMFVAHNTVSVDLKNAEASSNRDTILFIGTIYRQKGLMHLLEAYESLRDTVLLPMLNIVGNGPDFAYIKDWVENHNMADLIQLRGAVYDALEKAKYFNRAIACISPLQAGLSVLESMGHGVPFITTRQAITGGELFNICNGENGVLLDSVAELKETLRDIALNKQKFIKMGEKARAHYVNNRTPEKMAGGLWAAIQYVLGKNQG